MPTKSRRALPGVPEVKAMRIATRSPSIDRFVAAFHPFCDDTTCFIPTPNTRPPGYEAAFVIALATGAPALRGVCVVREVWTTSAHAFGRPGVLLQLRRLTHDSKPVYDRLLAARARARGAAVPAPIELTADATIPTTIAIAIASEAPMPPPIESPIEYYAAERADSETPTIAMPPLELELVPTDGIPDCLMSDEPHVRVAPRASAEHRTLLGVGPLARRPRPPRAHHFRRVIARALTHPGGYPATVARSMRALKIAIVVGIAGLLALLLFAIPRVL